MMVSSSKVVVVFFVPPAEDSSDGSWHGGTIPLVKKIEKGG